MDHKLLLRILTEWAIRSQEYNMLLFIYKYFKIGIPVKLLYNLPQNNKFFSLSSASLNHGLVNTNDIYLRELLCMFKKSKYKKLENWDNIHGYLLTN